MKKDRQVESAIREGALLRDMPLILTTDKPVKADLSLDAGVLAAIDAEARRRGLTRSPLVEWLARMTPPRAIFQEILAPLEKRSVQSIQRSNPLRPGRMP